MVGIISFNQKGHSLCAQFKGEKNGKKGKVRKDEGKKYNNLCLCYNLFFNVRTKEIVQCRVFYFIFLFCPTISFHGL